MSENKIHTIWSNENLDLNDWLPELKDEYPGLSEEGYCDLIYKINDDYLYDERANLNIQLSQPIFVMGTLGLWNGKYTGYKMLESGNIRDCLFDDVCDYKTWFVDEKGDLRFGGRHHDGTNLHLYREMKDDLTEDDWKIFENKLSTMGITEEDIAKYTRRLGNDIAKVYGWELYDND